jgi:peptidoglycan/LPS O-acetylase OafA/YrhL
MRVPQLDLLRFLAVFLVLGRHLPPCPEPLSPWLFHVTRAWHRGGWVGVDLFFVLSGFLVSGLLFREHERTGGVRAGYFLIRRGFKIYPAFWVLLAATLVFGGLDPRTPKNVLGELVFFQNYLGRLWNHTWTLAIEEHFYFLLAGFVAWRCRRRPEAPFAAIPALFAVVALVCLGLRFELAASGAPYSHVTHLFPTHLRIDSLLFGVLLSHAWHLGGLRERTWLARAAPALALGGVALLAPAFVFKLETTPWLPVVGLTGIYLGAGMLMLAMLAIDPRRLRWLAPLTHAGRDSYSIYLWHMPVLFWGVGALVRSHGPLDWRLYAVLYLSGALVVGIAMARLIEIPVLHLRDRLYPSRSGSLAPELETHPAAGG